MIIDRASTFSDPEVVDLLRTKFVSAAIDQWYQRRQNDAEGRFYQKIARQGPRKNMRSTTQGLYACTADGKLLGYTNNRGPERVKRMLKKALDSFEPSETAAIETGSSDPRYPREVPQGGRVVRVTSKTLGGFDENPGRWVETFQRSLGRDNLWILKDETEALCRGELNETLKRRLVRFHLIDNTRGEPPMWKPEDVWTLELKLVDGTLSGRVHLETASGDRGFRGDLLGYVASSEGRLTRFDLVARGRHWGAGRYTRNACPKGKFPFAVSFRLPGEPDEADKVPPQGIKGWARGYLQAR